MQNASKENIVFHEAGHATAIYLNNKTRNLPPVFFKIILGSDDDEQNKDSIFSRPFDSDCIAKIEGGRLIHSFQPLTDVTDDYITAFETDIINLLAGPLAEAKHVHQCDDEFFSSRLVNLHSLNYYGGRLDLALANEYLQSLYTSQQQQEKKLQQLFLAAFEFVNNPDNWLAISRLTHYIIQSNKRIFDFEVVESVLDSVK